MAKEVKARFKIKNGKITMLGRSLWEKDMLAMFKEEEQINIIIYGD